MYSPAPPRPTAMRREAVPMPALNWKARMPVPPPTEPSATGPPEAPSRARATWSARRWPPAVSCRKPAQVSPTTGSGRKGASKAAGSRSRVQPTAPS